MKLQTINKQDIPDWEFGDVVIKKFSFADKIKMAGFVSNVSVKKNVIEQRDVEKIDTDTLGIYTFAAGIHSVKDKDNYEFIMKPHSFIDDKVKFVIRDDIEYSAGQYILEQIKVFNQEIIDNELKKKLN